MIPLNACVTETEVTYLNDQIATLKKRVEKIEGSVEGKMGQDLDSRLQSILRNQATLSADMDQLREEIKNLSGRADDNEHVIQRIVEEDLSELDTVKTRFPELSQRVANLEIKVMGKPQTASPEQMTDRESDRQASIPAEPEKKKPTVVPPVPAETESKEMTLYNAALGAYKEDKFEESVASFKDFLKKYPRSDLADNAHFWIGESYMGMKRYEQAILAFQEVIKNYPKGNKVPGALLKQAMAFLEIKDKTSSSLLFKKIIRNYPNSDEAKIAQAKLKTLQ
jgi:tol-pal system protein YbgF